jgi:hypothetical protein
MPSHDRQRVQVTLRRLPRGDSRFGHGVIYRGRVVDARDVAPVELALGFLGPGYAWWDVSLPARPDCGDELVWREPGVGPGTPARRGYPPERPGVRRSPV